MKKHSALRVTLIYLAVGSLWIIASDAITAEVLAPATSLTADQVQTAKGLTYVALSGCLVFVLVRVAMRESQRSSDELGRLVDERTRELDDANASLRDRNRDLSLVNRDLKAFSYSVSHDLRAPVRAITGFATIVRKRHADALPGQAAHYLDNVLAASARMDRMIDDLLRYAQLGAADVVLAPTSILPIVETIARERAQEVSDVGGSIVVTDHDAIAIADATLVTQAIGNLVDNAIRYRSQDRQLHVRIDIAQRDGRVAVSVADNGIGIPAEQRDRVFTVFQRLHGDGDGTGIGLAIARRAAEAMRGALDVDSSPDGGSTFALTLEGASR
ncbi:MAG: hypothetical protein EA382_19240 [Spirochaetaceae bacterium]|nr:MAG: hypothetical protein EA382_19240 [Spirochaetaceae bacterium]